MYKYKTANFPINYVLFPLIHGGWLLLDFFPFLLVLMGGGWRVGRGCLQARISGSEGLNPSLPQVTHTMA